MSSPKRTLVYGFGNPGRQDDGLGPAFAEMIEQWKKKNASDHIQADSNYQLNVEDALLISEYDVVVFADATIEKHVVDFLFEKLDPSRAEVKYTLHAASPGYILELCHSLYNKFPETWLMRLKGYEWEMQEGLTPKAAENLDKAFAYFISGQAGQFP
jgi:hydrogenase maturation protease